jgi:hypothetical protein
VANGVSAGVFAVARAFLRSSEKDVARSGIPPAIRHQLQLAGAPGGQALRTIDEYGTTAVFKQGGGSFFNHHENIVNIDITNGSPLTALAHETTHARWFFEGRAADVAKLSRTDYIDRALEEETDAVVSELRTTMELHNKGIRIPSSAPQPHYMYGYNRRIQFAYAEAQSRGGFLTAAERDQAGQLGGRYAVSNAFHTGQLRTSINQLSYPDYYGRHWDQCHASRNRFRP